MRRLLKRAVISGFAAAGLLSLLFLGAVGVQAFRFNQTLRWLQRANATNDAIAAASRGDRRLTAIRGFPPGVPDLRAHYAEYANVGFHDIPFTSDAVATDAQQQLNQLAYSYARTYNAVLLARLSQ